MQVQVKLGELAKIALLAGLLGAPGVTYAGCFDFSTLISEPLHPLTTGDHSGKLIQGYDWASVRGIVNTPLEAVLKDLVVHGTTKSSRVDKMDLKHLDDPRYLTKQEVSFEVDPFPFVSVKWKEIWAFNQTEGPQGRPNRVVISYEKTEGTSHIAHLCGSYVLQRMPDNRTDVFIYEEVKADQRSEKDTLAGLRGNLKALNGLKP